MTVSWRQVWRRSKRSLGILGAVSLALFMLFLSIMTYRYGGGFSDWKATVTIVTLLVLALVVGRLGFTSAS